ncbi:hypothetical protein C8R44DRAFT_877872 [Mycena epipterygia]|nr:hypothetical protein C8R44DRAFT_877872 [Mycena epipterygia]
MASQVIHTFIDLLLPQYPEFELTPTLRDNVVSILENPSRDNSLDLGTLLTDAGAPWGVVGGLIGLFHQLMKAGNVTRPDGVGAIAQKLQSMTVWLISRFAMVPRSTLPTVSSPSLPPSSSAQVRTANVRLDHSVNHSADPAAATTYNPAAPLAGPSTRSPSPSLSDFGFSDEPSKIMRAAAARWDEGQLFRLSPVSESDSWTTDESGDGKDEEGEEESITITSIGKGKGKAE